MKRGFATIRDIARELNVSISTVSRALRGHQEVNVETREAVLSVAKRLNYRPHPAALSLLNQRTRTIGVLIPEIANPFFAAVISGIERTADTQGYHVLVCQSYEHVDRERELSDHLMATRVEGLVVSISAETTDSHHFQNLLERGYPVVFIDRMAEDLDTHKVVNDDYGGAVSAIEHLVAQGCRRIAHIAGPSPLGITRDRHRGYRDALEKAGLPYDPTLVVESRLTLETGQQAAAQLLSLPQPPDAIFAANDRSAYGVILEARKRGIRIPADLALVGFGDLVIEELLQPSLTTVAQPAFEMGRRGSELLFELMNNPDALTDPGFHGKVEVLPTTLVVRESSSRR